MLLLEIRIFIGFKTSFLSVVWWYSVFFFKEIVTKLVKMRLFVPRFASIQKVLDFYSQFNPSPLSIKQFIDFGKCFIRYKLIQWLYVFHLKMECLRFVCVFFYIHIDVELRVIWTDVLNFRRIPKDSYCIHKWFIKNQTIMTTRFFI